MAENFDGVTLTVRLDGEPFAIRSTRNEGKRANPSVAMDGKTVEERKGAGWLLEGKQRWQAARRQ